MPIEFKNIFYTYGYKTPFAFEAIKDVSFKLDSHEFLAVVGKTGSGKSTIVQHLNGLLLPTSGEMTIDEFVVVGGKKKQKVRALRKHVGLVFQFPEYQLFEETVLKDVAFGPKNFGATTAEANEIAAESLLKVGIPKEYFQKSPFELSGGEKRRVAIAGIIALQPSILVLDEPTAGLDPQGERDMLELFHKIYESGTEVILVTHNMDIVLEHATLVMVVKDGQVARIDKPINIFQDVTFMKEVSLEPPLLFKLASDLKERGLELDMSKIKDIETLVLEVKKARELL